MNTAIATRQNGSAPANVNAGQLMESVLIKGDLSKLTPQERTSYYMEVCRSVGLNPLTQPLQYIILNGKLTLYARKDCTDQLRMIHNVSVSDLSETEREGVFVVTAKVVNGGGRTDMAKGAVNIAGLKGENLANALMKAETKAKRRATLSICGLGMLDELEVEDIPAAAKGEAPAPKRQNPHVTRVEDVTEARPRFDESGARIDWIDTSMHRVPHLTGEKAKAAYKALRDGMFLCETPDELVAWGEEHAEAVATLGKSEEFFQLVEYQPFLDELRAKPEPQNLLQAG